MWAVKLRPFLRTLPSPLTSRRSARRTLKSQRTRPTCQVPAPHTEGDRQHKRHRIIQARTIPDTKNAARVPLGFPNLLKSRVLIARLHAVLSSFAVTTKVPQRFADTGKSHRKRWAASRVSVAVSQSFHAGVVECGVAGKGWDTSVEPSPALPWARPWVRSPAHDRPGRLSTTCAGMIVLLVAGCGVIPGYQERFEAAPTAHRFAVCYFPR